ncbi:MAG: DUF362 domain-containing protein [Chloroflexota bacterium]
MDHRLNRRSFLKTAAAAGGYALAGSTPDLRESAQTAPRILPVRRDEVPPATIAFVKTRDRAEGVARALDLLGINPVEGKRVLIKPNYNTADPCPGSTHNDALRALVAWARAQGANAISVGDRSYAGARAVMTRMGVFALAEELGFEAIPFNDLPDTPDYWKWVQPQDGHWRYGFLIARAAADAEALITTSCLKTHQYGGQITMSLKNSVGLLPKAGRCGDRSVDLMNELHGSPHMRKMIAEINLAYTPALVVVDGIEAFTHGGPMTGTRALTEVVLAGTDRVALDAVGVAILRKFGTTDAVSRGRIFDVEQIAHAVTLGLGVRSAEQITLITDDPASAAYADEIAAILHEQG